MLIIGSSAYKEDKLSDTIKTQIDKATQQDSTFIVAEAHGACRRFKDYLATKKTTSTEPMRSRSENGDNR